jgi:hypothetical protein
VDAYVRAGEPAGGAGLGRALGHVGAVGVKADALPPGRLALDHVERPAGDLLWLRDHVADLP